jgi:putative oxidoreductase
MERRRRHEAGVRRTIMEKIDRLFASFEPLVLSIFRVICGLLLFQFGVAKLFKFPAVPMFANVTVTSLYGAAGCLELVFGGLLILGLFTRATAFILCGEMAFAYFIEHFPRSFFPVVNLGNLAIMLCFSCLYFVCAGGGPFSLDAVMRRRG